MRRLGRRLGSGLSAVLLGSVRPVSGIEVSNLFPTPAPGQGGKDLLLGYVGAFGLLAAGYHRLATPNTNEQHHRTVDERLISPIPGYLFTSRLARVSLCA